MGDVMDKIISFLFFSFLFFSFSYLYTCKLESETCRQHIGIVRFVSVPWDTLGQDMRLQVRSI